MKLDSNKLLDYTLIVGFSALFLYAVGHCLAYYTKVLGPICY